MFENLRQDVRHGLRMLLRNPGFSLVAIASIAVGVAVSATMFSVADGLALRPLPVPRPGEVLTINATSPLDQGQGLPLSYPDYVDVRDRTRSFRGVTAHRILVTSFAVRPEDQASSRLGYAVSGNFFDVMEVRPALGRFFVAEEDRVAGRNAVAVLAHETWVQLFAADPGAVGRTMRIGGMPFTVIGVAPEGFTGLELVLPGAYYVPMAMLPALSQPAVPDILERRDIPNIGVKARLKPGVSVEAARAEVVQIGTALRQAYPATNGQRSLLLRTHLQSRRAERGPAAVIVAMLLTLALAVLLVACANVAGLLISRAPARAREIAVRVAIGAGRWRLMRQLITETMLLAAAGGAAGIALAYGAITLLRLRAIITDIGVRVTFEADGRVVAVAIALAAISTVVSGLVPAWRAARIGNLAGALRSAAADESGRKRLWGRHTLVAGQVALALALVTVGVFLYRALGEELARGPGFRTERATIANLNPGLAGYDQARANVFYDRLKTRVRALPGVTAVGLATVMPMNQDFREVVIAVPEGYQFPKGTESVRIASNQIDEGYFDAMRMRILDGRGILASDTADAPVVAVVNQTLARRYWPEQRAVGRRIRVRDGIWATIVGVAADSKYNFITEAPIEFVYLARVQSPAVRSTLVVATTGSSAALAAPIRDAVRSLDREVPVTGLWTMEDYYDGNAVGLSRMLTTTVGTMGLVGVALAMVGLYGLVAYAVSRRTREIGIRMAMGARPSSVLRMVMRHGLLLTGVGSILGLVITTGVNGLLRGMFPSSQGIDLTIYTLVVPALLAITLLAALVPALRAARIDPLAALRQD